MPKPKVESFELSINVEYQREEWGLWEGFRDLVSNAIDGEVEWSAQGKGQATVGWSKQFGGTAIIRNMGVKLPREVLLMGTTTKVHRSDLIGQFGEGLNMSFLALVRAGYTVQVFNSDEEWSVAIRRSQRFDAEVLAVDVRTLTRARGYYQVSFGPIPQDSFNEMRRLFLKFDPHFKQEETVVPNVSDSRSRILLQPKYKGMIYVKGVFVTRREDLMFGYDLNMKLNRDRHMVDEWDLKYKLAQMLRDAVGAFPERFQDHVTAAVMENQGHAEVQQLWAFQNTKAGAAITDAFTKKHGDKAVPVANIAESKEAARAGMKGVVVGPELKKLLEAYKGDTAAKLHKHKTGTQKSYGWEELDESEQKNLEIVAELIDAADVMTGRDWKVLERVEVVDFNTDDILGTFNGETHRIRLAKKIMTNFTDVYATLVHEISHLFGDDGDKSHEFMMEELHAQVVAYLVNQREMSR